MMFVKLARKRSGVHGWGCFSVGRIPRGTVLSFWGDAREVRMMTGRDHARRLRRGSRLTRETAVRLLGDWFVESRRLEEKDPTDYMNHSPRPNVGYAGGLLFALKDIARGDELFLDYRLLNAEYETNVVRGLTPAGQLQASAKQVSKAFRRSRR